MRQKKIWLFILLSFVMMAAIGLLVHSIGQANTQAAPTPAGVLLTTLLYSASMFIPLLSVVITRAVFKEPVFEGLGVSFRWNRWWWIGWLLMAFLSMAIMGVSLLMPGAQWGGDGEIVQAALKQMPAHAGPWGLMAVTFFSGLFAGATINAFFAFGEEIGWRGFLMKELQGKKFLVVALIIGLIWGLWHAPVILNGHNYPQHPVAGVPMMVALCLLLTPMLMYFRIKSGSVVVAAVMHGTVNALAGLSNLFVTPANDLLYGAPGLAGLLTLLLFDLALFLYDRYVGKEHIFTKTY
ncbi:MAG: CPBP family intramembrane metalloprotease [Bacteroidales bacterium]|nr:CPBP family intramembrane metalloprotease [Bacteroidales bacterium]